MKELDDTALLELIRQSSYPAFNEFYHRNWKYIYSIAYRKTGSKDDAFDLTQTVFMEFYDRREELVINIPLKNYLRTAIIYKLSNFFRTKGFREKQYQNFLQFLSVADTVDTLTGPQELHEAEMKFEEMVELVYQTIEGMPEKMKEIFLLSRSEEYSIIEIAEKLNISPQTVKNQVSNALNRLRTAAAGHNPSTAHLLLFAWLTNS